MGIENQKIGKFENPEDLAKALEDKNQNLADRIREISKAAIEKDSKDLRKTLQEELTPEEQSEIREALPESGVEKILDKKTSTDIGKEVVGEAIGEENADKIGNLFKKTEKLSKRFDQIGEIFKSKGIMAGFGAIILMFKGLFTGDFSGLDKILHPEKEGEKSEKKEVQSSSELLKDNDLKYVGGVKMLYLMKGDKSKKYTTSMLLQKEIRERKFEELKTIYKEGKTGISKKLGLEGKGDDTAVYSSLQLLIENEDFIAKALDKINPNWKNQEIKENLQKIGDQGGVILEKIIHKVEDTHFSLNPVDAMNQLKGVHFLNISLENGKIAFGDLEERKGLLSKISEKTLIQIISSNEEILNASPEQINRLYGLTNDSKEEKDFVNQLLQYKKDIVGTLSGLFGENLKSKYLGFFDTHGLNMKEIIELYLITGGKTNIGEYNTLEKSTLYLKLWKILGADESFRGEFFDQQLVKGIENKSIPEDVSIILGSIFSKVSEGFITSSTQALKEIWHAIPTKDKLIIGGAAGFILFMSMRFAPLKAIGMVSIVAMITTSLISAAAINKSTGKVYTKEDVEKIVQEALQKKS